GGRAGRGGHAPPLLAPEEEVLGAPVPALDPRVRRVAAAAVVLELTAHRRELVAVGSDTVEEPPQRARLERRHVVARVQSLDLLQIPHPRAAALVAPPLQA